MLLTDYEEKIKAFPEHNENYDGIILKITVEAIQSGLSPADLLSKTNSKAANRYLITLLNQQGLYNVIHPKRIEYFPENIALYGMEWSESYINSIRDCTQDVHVLALLNQCTRYPSNGRNAQLWFTQWFEEVEYVRNQSNSSGVQPLLDVLDDHIQDIQQLSVKDMEAVCHAYFYFSHRDNSAIASDVSRGVALPIIQKLVSYSPALQQIIKQKNWSPRDILLLNIPNLESKKNDIAYWLHMPQPKDYWDSSPELMKKIRTYKDSTVSLSCHNHAENFIDFLRCLGRKKAEVWLKKYGNQIQIFQPGLWLPEDNVKSSYSTYYIEAQNNGAPLQKMQKSLGRYYKPLIEYWNQTHQDYFLFDIASEEVSRFFHIDERSVMTNSLYYKHNTTLEEEQSLWINSWLYLVDYDPLVPSVLKSVSHEHNETSLYLS